MLTLAAAVWMVPRLGFDLIPSFSQGEFSFLVELPEGTPLEITDRFLADVDSILEEDEAVGTHSTISGGRGLSLTSTGTEGENTGRIQVRMAAGTTPEQEAAVISRLRERLDTVGIGALQIRAADLLQLSHTHRGGGLQRQFERAALGSRRAEGEDRRHSRVSSM